MKSHPPVHRVTGYMTGNVYIIEGDELALVDTGFQGDSRLVASRIGRIGRSPGEIAHILLTHFHVDHAGAAASLKRLSGARVYAHREDVPFLQGDGDAPGIFRVGAIGRALSHAPGLTARAMRFPPVEVDVALKDGDSVPFGDGISVMHTPGHTPGSACFFWEKEGILFTGDTVINTYRLLTLPTIGFSSDFGEAGRSASRVASAVEGARLRMICPGHGPVVENNPAERLKRFEKRALRRIGEGQGSRG